MNSGRATTVEAYARAIEREWSAFLGGTVILSPRDWALIADWHARGIRLEIVREAIEASRERSKRRARRSPPRGLKYIATAVEEGWSAVQEGRVARAEGAEPVARVPLDESRSYLGPRFRRRAESEPEGSAFADLLLGLARRLDQGESVETVEAALDEQLRSVLPEAWTRDANAEVQRRMARFRERMGPEAFESTVRRATLDLLRRRAGLPRSC